MATILLILLLIAVLLVTVLVHEWGHFFAAKKSGMIVEEFGFGIPPKLWSFKKGETEYSINALPIGGFVKIAGENGIDESLPASKQFDTKPWYLKAVVLVAGVVCNVLLAFVLFTAAHLIGMPSQVEGGTPTVIYVGTKTPASEAGIQVGDQIKSIVADGNKMQVLSTESLRNAVMESSSPIAITYSRAGEEKTVSVMPAQKGTSRMLGIAVESIGTQKDTFFPAMKHSVQEIGNLISRIWSVLVALVGSLFTHNAAPDDLSGPVGLAKQVGSAASFGFAYLLAFTAAISVNLAVLNIMPFPALDGGRLLVVFLEAITRRRFSQKVVAYIHAAGFLILIILMIVLTISDIRGLS